MFLSEINKLLFFIGVYLPAKITREFTENLNAKVELRKRLHLKTRVQIMLVYMHEISQ